VTTSAGDRQQDTPARFRGFDGLRGVAILLVLLWHTRSATQFPVGALGPARPLVMTGWAGVDLFFALSGFLITSLLLREEAARVAAGAAPGFALGRFYLRRALRILPVFYAVFLLNSFLLSRFELFESIRAQQVWHEGSRFGLWPYALFLGTYFLGYGRAVLAPDAVLPGEAYEVFWSLSVEEHFYLLWPAFLLLCRSTRVRVAVSLAVCLGLPVLRELATARGWDQPWFVHFASQYRLDSILWGGLAALARPQLSLATRTRRGLLAAMGLGIVALVGTHSLSVLPRPTPLGAGLGLSLLAAGTALLLIEMVVDPSARLVRALEWRPLVGLGKLSYAVYLIHLPMMDVGRVLVFARPRTPNLLNFLLAFGVFGSLSVLAAWILHRLIERPALAVKQHLELREAAARTS
jgi:peptidoglycan/LPS O-acetylase OafA/YrhL